MKVLVTGMNGTVAPALAQALSRAGHIVISWDRSVVPTDNPRTVHDFIKENQPDWFFHVATGSSDWAEYVARVCSELGIRFLFTSSASVFSTSQHGPFSIEAVPKPDDEYGRYKLECEQRIRVSNPNALIARLGWQIGLGPGGNQMVEYLDHKFNTTGFIDASIHWYPACSFLPDTSRCLIQLIEKHKAGLYQLDGNPGLNFYEIAVILNKLVNKRWIVNPVTAPVQNNLMIDSQIQMPSILSRT